MDPHAADRNQLSRKNQKKRYPTLDPPAADRNQVKRKNQNKIYPILSADDHRQLDQARQGPGPDAMSQLYRLLQLKCMMKCQEEWGANQFLVRRKGSMNKQNEIRLNRGHPVSLLQLFYLRIQGSELPPEEVAPQGGPRGGLFPSSQSYSQEQGK